MKRVLNFKATNPYFWALVVAIGAGLFLYANHSTIASHISSVKPFAVENSGLGHAPAVTGMGGSDMPVW